MKKIIVLSVAALLATASAPAIAQDMGASGEKLNNEAQVEKDHGKKKNKNKKDHAKKSAHKKKH